MTSKFLRGLIEIIFKKKLREEPVTDVQREICMLYFMRHLIL